jgi:putative transposase
LNCDSTPAAPNRAWAGDISYFATEEGWLFLAAVVELFSRSVVGWSMQPYMRRSLAIDALEIAWFRPRPDRNNKLILHSDRGSQFASDDFNKVLKGYAIAPSMSDKGNCSRQCLLGNTVRLAEGGTAARPVL